MADIAALRKILDGLDAPTRAMVQASLGDALCRVDPAVWAHRRLDMPLDPWQAKLVRVPRGKRAIALTHRQAGKSTGAGVALAHELRYSEKPTTSLCISPTQRQSAELIGQGADLLETRGWDDLACGVIVA